MYGETPMAKSEKRFKAPPPKVFNKPKRPLSAKVLIAETRTPGTGICEPNRNTAKTKSVKKMRRRVSLSANAFLMKVNIRSPRLIHQLQ